MDDLSKLAAKLTPIQREVLLALDPRDVDSAAYQPFKGQSGGLFNIAPGWMRMEMSPLGLALKAHLEQETEHDL